MNDEELLRLAAHAAKEHGVVMTASTGYVYLKRKDGSSWSPFQDDGDAFRLAVLLEMEFGINRGHAYAHAVYGRPHPEIASNKTNWFEAARRAIVCAAAVDKRALPIASPIQLGSTPPGSS